MKVVAIGCQLFYRYIMRRFIAVVVTMLALGQARAVTINDRHFIDEEGRKLFFRGFNVSGTVKLTESGFAPFKNVEDARYSLELLRKRTGANMIRLTMAWEGFHPAVDQFDEDYAGKILSFIKIAVEHELYVLLDYHSDIYSRHIYGKKNRFVGNGAPAWITPVGLVPPKRCLPLCLHWSQNGLTNSATRKAYRHFWENAPIETSKGTRHVQTEFLWQLKRWMTFLGEKLSAEEKKYVLGLDPFNEPMDGGLKNLDPGVWERLYLWPFYARVRELLDSIGWSSLPVFAEPLVYWNVKLWPFVRPTGAGHVDSLENGKFVFNVHLYDPVRQSFSLKAASSREYAQEFEEMRKESERLNVPVFVSEFGAPLGGRGGKDPNNIIKAMFQGLEIENHKRVPQFDSSYISSSQWHWDIYKDIHKEPHHRRDRLVTDGDAWNGEDFSVIRHRGREFTLHQGVIQRAYPRKINGDLHFFQSSNNVINKKGKALRWLNWSAPGMPDSWLSDSVVMALTGNDSTLDSEIFLPSTFNQGVIIATDENYLFISSGMQARAGSCLFKLEREGEGSSLRLYCKGKRLLGLFPVSSYSVGKTSAEKDLDHIIKHFRHSLTHSKHPLILD